MMESALFFIASALWVQPPSGNSFSTFRFVIAIILLIVAFYLMVTPHLVTRV